MPSLSAPTKEDIRELLDKYGVARAMFTVWKVDGSEVDAARAALLSAIDQKFAEIEKLRFENEGISTARVSLDAGKMLRAIQIVERDGNGYCHVNADALNRIGQHIASVEADRDALAELLRRSEENQSIHEELSVSGTPEVVTVPRVEIKLTIQALVHRAHSGNAKDMESVLDEHCKQLQRWLDEAARREGVST